MLRTSVIIDYQNVHLTGHQVFNSRGNRHESLIEPMHFARAAILERNARKREGYPKAEVSSVHVFRGLHNPDHHWEQHRRCSAQAAAWRASGAVVELRDLKYTYERGGDGSPIADVHGKKVPIGRPTEKGIDVLCALACVREAVRPDVDLVILASRDTDLVPVLDELFDRRGEEPERYAQIETVAWYNPLWLEEGCSTFGNLRPTSPRRIWNTNMGRHCFEASLDRGNYR